MSIDQMNHYQRKLAFEMDSWDLWEALGENEPITVVDGRSAEGVCPRAYSRLDQPAPQGDLLQFHQVPRQVQGPCLLLRRHRMQRLDEDGAEAAGAGISGARADRGARLVEAGRSTPPQARRGNRGPK